MTAPYQFQAPPVARNNNRVNTSGVIPAVTKGRTSLRIANILQAGQTMPIPASGTEFYLRTATDELQIKPSGGVFSGYSVGEGMRLDESQAFSMLEVRNDNAFPVVFELFVGFQGFIDNKLILATSASPQVTFPTYDTPNSAASVDIEDKSAQQITDINGGEWYAIYRVAIVISNTDSGTTLLLQKADSVVSNGPAILAIFPQTSIRLDTSGDYRLHLGGANINAIVSEIYNCIPK